MERRKLVLKVVAIVVAVGLGGTLVAYRAGAFQQSPAPQPDPQSQPLAEGPSTPESQPTPNIDPVSATLMLGSKSAPTFMPSQPAVTPSSNAGHPSSQPTTKPQSPTPNPTFIGGSKSMVLVPSTLGSPNSPQPVGTPPKPATRQPTAPPQQPKP